MARLMSVALTEQQVRDRAKTETRRLGWTFAEVGMPLTLCRKVMGRRKGEPLVRIAHVRVTGVRREPLHAITPADVRAEGFGPDYAPDWWLPYDRPGVRPPTDHFVDMFCEAMRCTPDTPVTVVQWEYVEPSVQGRLL